MKKLKTSNGFVFPILIFVMSAVMITSVTMMAVMVIKLKEASAGSNCGLRAYYAAQTALNRLVADDTLGTVGSSCQPGSYVKPSTGACGLPGSTNTQNSIDSDCSYSVQILSKPSAGKMNVDAIGRCNSGECRGNASTLVKINTNINYPVTPPADPHYKGTCPSLNGSTPKGSFIDPCTSEQYQTAWYDYNNDSIENSGECWFADNVRNLKDNKCTPLNHEYGCPGDKNNLMADCSVVSASTGNFGYLYDSTKVMSNLCPIGWRLATLSDWSNLTAATDSGAKLKAKTSSCDPIEWNCTGYAGDNGYGFLAKGAGYHIYSATKWQDRTAYAYYWANDSGTLKVLRLDNTSAAPIVGSPNSGFYYSVRCVKD